MIFRDREEAGRRLGNALLPYGGENAYVLAIPRGGVVVGASVARVLNVPLDVIVPRKLRSPYNPELAIGAVAHDGTVYLDVPGEYAGADEAYLQQEVEHQRQEIARRLQAYRGGDRYPLLEGRSAIVVDDGIATGSTMIAALRAVRKMPCTQLIAAIPVAPAEGLQRLQREADHVVCLYAPPIFYAVGQFYEDFTQTTDDEVMLLLHEAAGRPRSMTADRPPGGAPA
jgi:predicted phosphoribosyltransferase